MTVSLAAEPADRLAAYAAAIGVPEDRAASFLLADALLCRSLAVPGRSVTPPPAEPTAPPPPDEAGVTADKWVRCLTEEFQREGLPVRDVARARALAYGLLSVPGCDVLLAEVLCAARRTLPAIKHRVNEARAKQEPDPFKWVPSLATWLERRPWEDVAAPKEREAPRAPVPVSKEVPRGS